MRNFSCISNTCLVSWIYKELMFAARKLAGPERIPERDRQSGRVSREVWVRECESGAVSPELHTGDLI